MREFRRFETRDSYGPAAKLAARVEPYCPTQHHRYRAYKVSADRAAKLEGAAGLLEDGALPLRGRYQFQPNYPRFFPLTFLRRSETICFA